MRLFFATSNVSWFRFLSFVLPVCVLLLAVLARFFARDSRIQERVSYVMPASVILDPNEIGGKRVDLPLGDTERARLNIADVLRFSDYRYVRYMDSSGMAFDIYLAYWSPGRAHFLEVGTHAPDNCWVANGMRLIRKERSESFSLENSITWPGNSRLFLNGSAELHVVYWHLFDGASLSYDNYGKGKTLRYILDNRTAFWAGDASQYFLRISSASSFNQLSNLKLFNAVINQIAKDIPLAARGESG